MRATSDAETALRGGIGGPSEAIFIDQNGSTRPTKPIKRTTDKSWTHNSHWSRVEGRRKSGGLAAVVLQQPAQPLLASDLSVLPADPPTIRGEQQRIAFALVISFLMIMGNKLPKRSPQR